MNCFHRWIPILDHKPRDHYYQCARCNKFIGTTLKETK